MRKLTVICLVALSIAVFAIACSGPPKETGIEVKETAVETKEAPAKNLTGDPFYDAKAAKVHDIRSTENRLVTLETNFGKMTLELFHDVAPHHADSFVARTQDGFYSNQVFHRVVAGFMIQGGDPTGTGRGNAGYNLPAEFSDIPHMEGTLSAARSQDPNSASCQFFICLDRNGSTEYLDGKYTVFGQLIRGYDVLHRIGKVPVGQQSGGRERSKPLSEVQLITSYLSDAEGNPLQGR